MPEKKILIRADGNTQIGLGHIYRCIAIAEMLEENFTLEFLLSKLSNFTGVIPSRFSIKHIPEEIEIAAEHLWLQKNYDTGSALMIADGYLFNSEYQKKIKSIGVKLVYIDDLAREYMYADAVLNHAPSAKNLVYKKEDYSALYLGTEYALLRKGFLAKAKKVHNKFTPIKNVLITLGGSDENNITLKILEALLQIPQIEKIAIVIGAAYPHKEKIPPFIESSEKNIKLYSNLGENEMLNLMGNCDAAFAPCSTTCLELIALNKPVFVGYSADNQLGIYESLKTNEYIFDLENLNEITVKKIKQVTVENLNNETAINKMLNLQKQLIDGRSGERIVKLIKELAA
ncbi:MAG: UDP-2,4-diacetamido-2,4,6-trideoxy-beta-L-altropyranose hydrolase [Bacteroidota bacterium]|nr:UDP-2,4-diacetamido-2,4,6-trideoxy-beta-L-altropyranose hydrolase [Bacteroidota bacterium]